MSFGDFNTNKNQKIIKISLIVVGALVALTIFVVSSDDKPEENKRKTVVYDEEQAVKTRYFNEAVPEIRNTVKDTEKLKKENTELKDNVDELNKRLKALEQELLKEQENNNPSASIYEDFPPPVMDYSPELGFIDGTQNQVHKITTNRLSAQIQKEESKIKDDNSTKGEEQSIYIPTGAITKAYLLGGVNAPTMTRGQNNPIPLLMKLVDMTAIPNHKQLNLKSCFVLGEAYGDLSDERVHVRLTNLSCAGDGVYVDHTIQGFVSDKDGTEGLAGNVISKQGAMLGRALLAGFIDGVGEAFSTQSQIVMASPLGTTTETEDISPGQKLENAGYAGLGKAAEKLSDFYMKMAESIEPRVETLGNKIVDITITRGIKILPKDIHQIKENEKASE